MANYRVISPTIPKLQELAALTHNLMYWTDEFRKDLGINNREKMDEFELRVRKWLKTHTEKVTDTKIKTDGQ